MMRMLVMLLFSAGLSLAGDVSGTWSGTLVVGGNEMPGYMALTQNGDSVTGTAGEDAENQHKIEKGTAEANQISIVVRPTGPTLLKFVLKQREDRLFGEVFEDGQRIGTVSLDRVRE